MFRYFTIGAIFVSIYSFSYIFTRDPFEFYLSYLIFMFYFPVFFVKFGVPKWPILVFLPLFIAGIIYCQIGLNTYQQFFKIFIGFFASCLFYHYVVQLFNYDMKLLFKYYMKSAYIVSIIGLIQITSFLVGFRFGYDFHWAFNKWSLTLGGFGIRINAVFSEPAYYAATIAPAFFVAVYNLIKRNQLFVSRVQSYAIVAAYLTTFSSLGILAIFFTFIFLLINLGFLRYSLIMIPALFLSANYAYKNVPEFRDRWDGTIEIYTTDNIYSYDIHGSSFVLYNNSYVAWQNFIRNPVFGTGLGSHAVAFEKYSLTHEVGAVQIDFNKADANSMLLRLMSEAGLYGMLIMLGLLFRSWIFKWISADDEYWVISNALALIILIYLIRQGHYFINGFPFFIWLHFYTAAENRRVIKENALKAANSGETVEPSSEKDIVPNPIPAS
jgi:hypothetical protein